MYALDPIPRWGSCLLCHHLGLGKDHGEPNPKCLSGENEASLACFCPLGSESRTHPPGPQVTGHLLLGTSEGLPGAGLFRC